MTSRIHRGFHRIGVVLALPVLLLAGWLASDEVRTERSIREAFAAYQAAPPQSDAFERLLAIPSPVHAADYTGAMTALFVALAFYAAARAIGWVLDGFLSPSPRP